MAKRKGTRGRIDLFTESLRAILEYGDTSFTTEPLMQKPEELGYSDSDLADAWRKWEARVLDHWREDPLANAGERPWAWWQYEAPEPRLYFGDLPPDEREPRPSIYDVDYETEDEYLERLNLLEGWELEGVELHRDLYRGGREKVLEDRAAQARARMVVVED